MENMKKRLPDYGSYRKIENHEKYQINVINAVKSIQSETFTLEDICVKLMDLFRKHWDHSYISSDYWKKVLLEIGLIKIVGYDSLKGTTGWKTIEIFKLNNNEIYTKPSNQIQRF